MWKLDVSWPMKLVDGVFFDGSVVDAISFLSVPPLPVLSEVVPFLVILVAAGETPPPG